MAQKIMTKFVINVIEYDATGYYYPTYKTAQTVIAESLEEATAEAIKRTPWKHSFGGGWTKKAKVITSEDIVVEA